MEQWVDQDFEIAVEVKGRDPKCVWEIVGIYRAPNEDMQSIERLAARTRYSGKCTKYSIIGGDLNLPYADWNGNAECSGGGQAFINRLVWENGFMQVVNTTTREVALLDVYLVWPESLFNSCSILQGISDHCRVLLEVEWEENYWRPQEERLVLVYHKANVVGLQTFLRDRFTIWASNGRCVEEVWNNFKNIILESIETFIPHKILRKNSDPEYYIKEVRKLKIKLRKTAQETFLRSVLKNEGKSWTEFYKYVKRRKGNRENIPAIKDGNGRLITDAIEKASSLNCYYSSVFSCERSIPQLQSPNSGEPFAINTNIIRKRLAALGKNKSVGPDGFSGEILKLGGKATIPYLVRLLDVTINNATLPSDWKKAIVVPIYKEGGPIDGVELQTSKFNLGGLQANGTRYYIVPE
ncbi:hypothetical protein B7P43_G17606 [Cryptotermes secundus]|uniref:Endonuclease/exonuclease/phosphatase domain-containing protein n=1 Tax=Cryptotermes secundus TaxID=105785 RepID=A0A2J7Q092_9NEOP|nr:hypothetical protein B7P43_G17606 [Cryptotermes secundus]